MMMEISGTAEKVKRFFSRYKTAAILLGLGLALLLLSRSWKSVKQENPDTAPQMPDFSLEAEEKRFAAALSRIDGAG
ncbi:MAG: hypothetical protein II784_01085, partial [Oscillospiraceae bacterium]|nr:hypothetical protein [Oscillospiraceae bacterium]